MGLKKKTSLRREFWKFLIWLLTGLGIAVVVPYCVLVLGINMGIATFADNSERQTKALVPALTATPDVTDILLPAGTKYLRLDKSYGFIDTNMSEQEYKKAMDYAKTGQMETGGKTQFLFVNREEEYLILQYYIGSQFINPWLDEHLPSPEVILAAAIIFNCLMVCIFLTTIFSKMLRKELTPLFEATKEIERQNLDFHIRQSKITEFEHVLQSFDNMRNSLKKSLEQQWRTEQSQREQIASLAHDLKTPLTVIQGNIDLLDGTNLDEEQQLYTHYAMESSEQMKKYIKLLIELSKASLGYELHKDKVELLPFWNHIRSQAEILCKENQLTVVSVEQDIERTITVDAMLLERAVMNLILNAADYGPEDTAIYLEAVVKEGVFEISVTDCGPGFSDEALRRGQERFYRGDQSRGSKFHYGMGLYIADSIVKQHNGRLTLKNSQKTHGGQAVIKIPLIPI